MAKAGFGTLQNDWLANTYDPTPVFSLFVQLVFKFLHPISFYIITALLLGLYFYSLSGLVSKVRLAPVARIHQVIFISLLLLTHSAAWRFGISRIFGADISYILEDGLAGQRLLGPVLQPSFFGVFLIASIFAFINNRPFISIFLISLSATIHPTYLLSAGALALAYCLSYFFSEKQLSFNERLHKNGLYVLEMSFFFLVLISPILFYTYNNFATSPTETTFAARQILVNFRIPHHALVSYWFNYSSILKLLILASGLFLTRKTKLFVLLVIPTGIGLFFTLIQLLTGSEFIALLFPWRISTFLIPISTALILDRVSSYLTSINYIKKPHIQKYVFTLSIVLIGLILFVGAIRQVLDFQRQAANPERELFEYIAEHRQNTDLYLIPVKMQNFRLAAGARAFVDFKSIPYKDTDVLEWYRRIKITDNFYQNPSCNKLSELISKENITHAIIPASLLRNGCPGLLNLFDNEAYSLYEFSGS